MGTNFHTAWADSVTTFRAVNMNAPLAALDLVSTYNRPVIIHCDGDISYDSSTGELAWSGTLRILFNDSAGLAKQNTVATGSVTLTDGQMAYVTLNETDDTVITVSQTAITTGAASGFLAYNRVVLAFRNTASDECFPVALRQQYFPKPGSIATKDFWQGTQAAYDALSPTYDSNTIYFIEEA